jgi:hypothetical protein
MNLLDVFFCTLNIEIRSEHLDALEPLGVLLDKVKDNCSSLSAIGISVSGCLDIG